MMIEFNSEMPLSLEQVVRGLGLWQYWELFAPLPVQVDGWIIMPGNFEDGKRFDLLSGLDPEETGYFPQFGPDTRWKKYAENLFDFEYAPLMLQWGRYYCNLYNTEYRFEAGDVWQPYRLSIGIGVSNVQVSCQTFNLMSSGTIGVRRIC